MIRYNPFEGLPFEEYNKQMNKPARFSTEISEPDETYADRVEATKVHRTDVLTPPVNTSPVCKPVFVATGEIDSDAFDKALAKHCSMSLGVYRPNLEDRKVGKVRVELVDDGFPLALREVAKVMTWAQSAKGYKDHDWQNLPNAEQALAAATSRHRSDYIIQRHVDGLSPEMCVDHESNIVHKAHEAFGVLAQLELLLRGKFE